MTIVPNVAITLPTLSLTDEELELVNEMLKRLAVYEVSNSVREAYYEGQQRIRHLGISIPPHLQNIETVVGWASTCVDVLDERLEWQGWRSYSGEDYGLDEIYELNELDIESGLATKDALIYGTAFVVVGSGYADEPHPLVTVESARNMTGIWDNRARRLSSALGINAKNSSGAVVDVTLYLPNSNIRLEKNGSMWTVVDRDNHNLGRVLVAQMVNNPRASRMGGRSEVTHAIMSYVDQGVRTMLGMEINREFYSFPQRYMLGADAEVFTDENGVALPGWMAVMTKMLAVPFNEESGQNPEVGQFTPASPAPYLEQVKGLAQMVAAEAAIPADYLGFVHDNPTSADAIRAGEGRLIRRAERRQKMFGRAWKEVGRLALLVQDRKIPDTFSEISNKWTDPATPTRAAAADEAVKLVGAGVIPNDSSILYDRIGLDPAEQKRLESEKRRARSAETIQNIRDAVAGIEGE